MSYLRLDVMSRVVGLSLLVGGALSLGCTTSSESANSGVGGASSQGGHSNVGQSTTASTTRGGNPALSATGGRRSSTGTSGTGVVDASGGASMTGSASTRSTTGGTSSSALGTGGRNSGGTTSSSSNSSTASGGITTAGRNSGGTTVGGKATGGTSSSQAGSGSGTAAVRIVGRTAPGTKGGVRFQWSGVSIQARFRGTQASIQLDDGDNQNEFTVVIDGKVMTDLVTTSGKTTYQLVSGLANAEHDLVVWRRTEAYYKPTEYLGLSDFGTGGILLPPAAAPERRIEIIGDSITCGYGNEGISGCSGTKPENNYLAYGSVAARTLGADLHTVAWSGIGIYRNYGENGPSTDTMPTRYDSALPTVSSTAWDFAKFMPQAVVINLGTNDFSTKGDPGQPYVDAYVKFVQHLRAVYPQAYIVCLIPVTEATTAVNSVVSAMKKAGDAKIESFDTNANTGAYGCDGHPNIAKHAAMGVKLAAELQRVMNW